MTLESECVPKLLDSVFRHACYVFAETAGIQPNARRITNVFPDRQVVLQGITAVASLGLPVGMALVFSFERSLVDFLFHKVTAELSIPEERTELYVREVAAEMVNTILGYCTVDFQTIEHAIDLSPPVVVEDNSCIDCRKSSVLGCMRICTAHGGVSVNLIGPRELFDGKLNKKGHEHGRRKKKDYDRRRFAPHDG